jgi:23S rRNA (cytosine1962-C5)-methyltransferase
MKTEKLHNALSIRLGLLKELDPLDEHHAALRLFNGFTEGMPGLAMDLYGSTLLIFDYAQMPEFSQSDLDSLVQFYRSALPWLSCVLLKIRRDKSTRLLEGTLPDEWVQEFGVRYAINLNLHQDATLYLDTRELREWIIDHLAGKSVLNTFAYTGSLGAAAMRGGARQVVQTDLDHAFLNLAQQTHSLNGWKVNQPDFIEGDFFSVVAGLKRQAALFDCVILDPPFFSETPRARFDLNAEYGRLLNKVRPLVAHNGWLVAVNNALFVSGENFMDVLKQQTTHGYLSIESLLPVPLDFTGPGTGISDLPADPAPFNHSTKIAVLRVRRKDEKQAT